jgi:23S rRNA (uracil1939-C5)-methyltransferase
MPVPVVRGEECSLEVEALGRGADGVGRIGSYVVLVAGALPGERARVRISSAARKFGRGELLAVERASPQRARPPCGHFLVCGGCDLQHLAVAAQAEHKRARLAAALTHALGDRAPEIAPMAAPPDPLGQRHKVALHLQGAGRSLRGGLRRARGVELVALRECPVSDAVAFALAGEAVAALRETGLPAWDERRQSGVWRAVVVRRAAGTGEACVLIVAARGDVRELAVIAPRLAARGATTVALNVNTGPAARLLGHDTKVLAGPQRIREVLAGTDYLVSPGVFFQTAPWAAARLVELAGAFLAPGPGDVIGDLYCGSGLFALALAPLCGSVFGIEENAVAVADARAAARDGRLRNVRLVTGRVADRLPELAAARPRAIVLDPPRAGCGAALAGAIAALAPARIAYVSCDPDALARDLGAFADAGYRARRVVPVDMFPHTHHLESFAELQPA